MGTITVTVDDQFADVLAEAIARKMYQGATAAPPAPPRPDPWADDPSWQAATPAAPQATQQPYQPPPGTVAPVNPQMTGGGFTGPSPGYAPNAVPPSPPQQSFASPAGSPSCQHGPMKFVAAGFSKTSGKPYPAFWACQGPREAQCKGVSA